MFPVFLWCAPSSWEWKQCVWLLEDLHVEPRAETLTPSCLSIYTGVTVTLYSVSGSKFSSTALLWPPGTTTCTCTERRNTYTDTHTHTGTQFKCSEYQVFWSNPRFCSPGTEFRQNRLQLRIQISADGNTHVHKHITVFWLLPACVIESVHFYSVFY